MRLLTGGVPTDRLSAGAPEDLSDEDLDVLYRPASPDWLRVNMISTLDGAANGDDGKSGGINNAADRRVFDCLRRLADAVLVGAGTARDEGYVDIEKPLVLVSRRGEVPQALRDAPAGQVWLVTREEAEHLEEARDVLGAEHVLAVGGFHVDLARARDELAGRGFRHVLSEGGPHLLRDLVSEGVVDELDLTLVPRLLGGEHPRITTGAPVDAGFDLRLLLEDHGTLIMRWVR